MELEKGLIRYVQVAVPDLRVVSFSIYGFDDCLEIKFWHSLIDSDVVIKFRGLQ
jgi:hypothetical protein